MFISEQQARNDMAYFSRKLQSNGYVSATDGNLSVRIGKDRVLVTPSGVRKEDLTLEALIVVDMEGTPVSNASAGKAAAITCPSTEIKVHLEVYKQRYDVMAVIHAHPPKSIALTVADVPFNTCILPEVVVALGCVPVVPYATPSTDELSTAMREYIRNSDVIMLARHGSVSAGPSLASAYNKMEKLEHNSKVLFQALALGGPKPFPAGEIKRLEGLRDYYGIKGKTISCSKKGNCSNCTQFGK